MLRLAAGARGWLALGTAVTLAITATHVGQGIAIAQALAVVFAGHPWQGVLVPLAVVGSMLVTRAVLLWARELVTVTTGRAVKNSLRGRLYAKLFELGPGYTAANRTGATQATVVDGVEKIDVYVSRFLSQLLGAALGALAILIGLVLVDPLVGGVLFAGALAITATPLLARRLQAERAGWFWGLWRRLGADYLDVLQGMTTLKAFGVSRERGRELARESHEFYRASIGFVAVANLRTGAMGLLSVAGVSLAIGLGAVRLATGQLDVLGLLLVLLLAREAFRPLEELQKAYHSAYPAISAAGGILELLDASPAVVETRHPQPPPASSSISFDRVSFGYRDGQDVIAGLSFAVEEGRTVAIVGRSGAGKSTLVALLLRFFDPRSGRILVGGQDIRELSLARLRGLISVVAQDTYLFHGTVRDNLLLGRPDAGPERVEAAAIAAGAHGFITRLPDGYDTVVGERGATLSGGERQRIAIARALLKDAPILVLDEATSSIDSANEAEIQQALDRLAAGRTTLVIAHRLSTVRDADRILLLDHGQVADAGTHAELLERSAGYQQLVAAQAVSR
ncbi:ABC transporter ATP-binding protein/permease [Nonomuraea sp. PA05]|uniref:ABC transporter ATP-binding protein/permease n=1 Tax=Nonomuraea sp. PA05 TaxID=2604466 RepID=UPI00165212A7|nr:ABC transporter ATP-binding protein [Nonomuraea sp. PA05]